ncbi:hypothetical protein BSL78_09603 [Apostichopus japonicus]|uniref:NTR domain-containing protein n=1 Tax=Stichopus japonicus TaxID=307972 RepID=A0A2G8KZS3_STIJA|nr:hypothetical protein BSL78_09603 [Apostichopus japonicus]
MDTSQFTTIIQSLVVFVLFIQLRLTSASQCLCDTDPVKTAYCNSKYSFKGTVLEIKDDNAARYKRDVVADGPSFSYEFNEIETLRAPMPLADNIAVEYRIRVDSIFGGVDRALLKQEITMYSTVKDRLCGNPTLKVDYGYLFQVDDLLWLDPCERIFRYKDVSKAERRGLHKLYRYSCKSSTR